MSDPSSASPAISKEPERSLSDSTTGSVTPPARAQTAQQSGLGRGAPPTSISATAQQHPSTSSGVTPASLTTLQPQSESLSTSFSYEIESEGELSEGAATYYASRDRDKAARGQGSAAKSTNPTAKPKKGKPNPIPSSASRVKLKGRQQQRGRASGNESDDQEEQEDAVVRERALSPGVPLLSAALRDRERDEDDEVERRDRGEELVRKRMRDRARVKKEVEKATRKRDLEARTPRQSQYLPQPIHRTSYGANQPSDTDDLPPIPSYPQPSRRNTEPYFRDVSRSSTQRQSFAGSVASTGGYFSATSDASADGTERGYSLPGSPTLASGQNFESLSPISPGSGAPLARGFSRAESIVEDVDESADQSVEERAYDGAGVDRSVGDDDEELEDEEEEDESEETGEVEYTLKDRQDAINIEHPFGLPIWKPALYKKSRSVTRAAETAVHATPSSSAMHHLAPANVLWTIFFGSWLFLVCVLVSGILWCTPWGGGKYGRVVWELGGYILWPFGKYVEGWSDTVLDDDEQEADEETDEGESPHDLENAGFTYGRGRARLAAERAAPQNNTSRATDLAEQHFPSTSDSPDTPRSRPILTSLDTTIINEHTALPASLTGSSRPYGATQDPDKQRSSSESTLTAGNVAPPSGNRLHDFNNEDHSFRVRALGRTMYWLGFYLVVGPLMLIVCILCWAMVFTVPMGKLLWVLLRHLANEPLSLHFRSPPKYSPLTGDKSVDEDPSEGGIQYPLKAGQRAPPVSRRTVAVAKAQGRIFGPSSTVLLCTYQAAGWKYYKYTIDGVNIMFINLLSLVFFVIIDDWFLVPYVEHHPSPSLFLTLIAGKAFVFVVALLSVIPLSYFIGMAVASISAQSSIGMGAVINASFGSIIEIILYCIALTQGKADLVEGSIVGSILAGVLLMPGLSMIGGAMRRKEQKFNARSAGVTSTMLIMAIIGILTPTLFYEIYGSFQLNCHGCTPSVPGGTDSNCKSCYYEHVDPVDDPFYKNTVIWLSYYCATILVLSYLVGLWFSLRTHASQIWQNAHSHDLPSHAIVPRASISRDQTLVVVPISAHPISTHQVEPSTVRRRDTQPLSATDKRSSTPRRVSISAPATHAEMGHSRSTTGLRSTSVVAAPPMTRSTSHARETSALTNRKSLHLVGATDEEDDKVGGHDAPNWSRVKSASVLMGCTILYAIIAEILVDVVDVVLDGSGIPEKLLGVTLFALVPNTTEFMNAISFAINGNIALSMEIGSAYALQVCLIQAPAMLAFTAYYSIGKTTMEHRGFTLVFPRWDVIAIIFSVFLLTYTYIEARANYYRGTILVLAYLALLGGFVFAPGDRDTEDDPLFNGSIALANYIPIEGVWAIARNSLFA